MRYPDLSESRIDALEDARRFPAVLSVSECNGLAADAVFGKLRDIDAEYRLNQPIRLWPTGGVK